LLIFVLLHKFASRFSSPSSLFSAQEVFDANTEKIPLRIMSANGDKLATVEEIRAEIAKMAKAIETRNVRHRTGGFGAQ
jgi:hypothetical protein